MIAKWLRRCAKRRSIWFVLPAICACFHRIPQRILNVHPSLLPSFPGLESQKQALEYGVKFAGCTVHFVDENLDAGPIVLQAVAPVEDDDNEDSLSARILKEEHRIYSEAVKIVLEGKYKIEGRRVILTS
jgi:phosphoribosylglycinamide formyltransferase 1